MAASMVTHGAIDADMFRDANPESMAAFSKIAHVLPTLRHQLGNPDYLHHWERLVRDAPDAERTLARLRDRLSGD